MVWPTEGVVPTHRLLVAFVAVTLLVLGACESERTGGETENDASTQQDAAVDTAPDTSPDAAPADAGVDADEKDVFEDLGTQDVRDGGVDVEPDMGLPPGVDCVTGFQCASGVCREGSCVPGSCSDGVKNQDETAVDCGGASCAPCGTGRSCLGPGDCKSGRCSAGTCAMPSCSDGLKNQQETDVDCGGPNCGPCADGDACKQSVDCQSSVCINAVCRPASCQDGVENNMETDVDCGGPNCAGCPDGASCNGDADCQNICTPGGTCQPCSNGSMRQVTGGSCGYQDRGTTTINETCQNNTWSMTGSTCDGVYYRTCAEIDDAQNMPANGTYTLDPDGPGSGSSNVAPFQAYCQMTYDGSRTGGWTLVLKVDGTTSEFFYGDARWTNRSLHNSSSLQPFNGTEAKLKSYLHVPFTEVHIVMETSSGGSTVQNSLSVYGQADSMLDLMGPDQFVPTFQGRSAWLGLMPNPSVQDNCNREGFNVNSPTVEVRIGLLGNNEEDCFTPDSFIGVGGTDTAWGPTAVSAGYWRGYDGPGSQAAMAIIFVE